MKSRPVSMMPSKNQLKIDFTIPEDDPDRINELFGEVLDYQLTPAHVKERMMQTESLEKKLQMIKMYQNFSGSHVAATPWTERVATILASIQKSKTPDIHTIIRLKAILTSANRENMESFIEQGGVSVLVRAIENRLRKRPFTELDTAVLYEILGCCKHVMNNAIGMKGFSEVPGAIEVLALCLKFEFKPFALQVRVVIS